MSALTADTALHDLVLPVSADDRPPFEVAWLRSREVVFAIHKAPLETPVAPVSERPFLGVVAWGAAGRFPDRIFGDMLPDPPPAPVSSSCPLEEVIERFGHECHGTLPVMEGGRFKGAVTRHSVMEALLSHGARQRPGQGNWERLLARLHFLESSVLRAEVLTHDLANALLSVDNLAELLIRKGAAHREVVWLRDTARHAVTLLERLREIGRGDDHTPEVTAGLEIIQGLARQARILLPEQVGIDLGVDAPRASLRVDRTDLERVVANLVVNAHDAMPDGGRLTLGLSEVEIEGREVDAVGRLIANGQWTCIRIGDTGHGMDESTLKSVFQPLFSTRAAHGRGLGLSTVQRLVRRNKGVLRCHSAPGQGTTFELLFPQS